MEGDHDKDGKLSFEEFAQMVSNTVSLVKRHRTSSSRLFDLGYREANDPRRFVLASFIYHTTDVV